MPFYDYALLALLISGGHGLDGFTLTLGADAIVQPNGGGLVLVKNAIQSRSGVGGESADHKHKDEINFRGPSPSYPTKPQLQNNQLKQQMKLK